MKRFCLRNLPAQPRQNRGEYFTAFFRREGLKFRAAECLRVATVGRILFLDELRRAFDEIQGAQITFLGCRWPTK